MSISSVELWQRIAHEGIASSLVCRSWAAGVAKTLPAAEAVDGLKVLQQLIKDGKLTKYQARILAGQLDAPLQRDGWHLLGTVKQRPFAGWQLVAKIDPSRGDKHESYWARWLSDEDLEKIRESGPALPRGIQLASLQHENLQGVQIPELVGEKLLVVVASPLNSSASEISGGTSKQPSKLLSDLSPPLPPDQATTIVRQVAAALDALHHKGIVHSRVFPDRVVFDGHSAALLQDPIATCSASVTTNTAGLLGNHLPSGFQKEHFLAPEFIAPGQQASLASDVYALGCVWWWLLTGKSPANVAASSGAQAVMAAQTETLPELPNNVQVSPAIRACLIHSLARNTSSRFSTAGDLLQAIDAATKVPSQQEKEKPSEVAIDDSTESTRATKQKPEKKTQKKPLVSATAAPTEEPAQKVQQASDSKPTQAGAKPKPLMKSQAAASPTKSKLVKPKSTAKSATSKKATAASKLTAKPSTALRSSRKRRSNPKWLIPVAAGCGFLIVVLLILKFSGALESDATNLTKKTVAAYVPKATETNAPEPDPLATRYEVVAGDASALWLPPSEPMPFPRDLLPAGAQLFLSLRPSDLLSDSAGRGLVAALGDSPSIGLSAIGELAGVSLEDIQQITLAFYVPEAANAFPQGQALPIVARVQLVAPKQLGELKQQWGINGTQQAGSHALLTTDADMAFYIPEQPLVDAQACDEFSVGPSNRMQEVAESEGATGPLTAQMNQHWQLTSQQNLLSILVSPRYLRTEGRSLFEQAPARLASLIQQAIGEDSRSAMLQVNVAERFYAELSVIGARDQDAPQLVRQQSEALSKAGDEVEAWFVEESPDPFWRSLAFRYPQMLRTLSNYTRFGVENGSAIANVYLPPSAATNLVVGSWIATRETATLVTGTANTMTPVAAPQPLSVEQFLAQATQVKFDQEPIETALQLVSEDANEGLPGGTPAVPFRLDGDAFEKGGITRNQQLRGFDMRGKTIRQALTEIAKRGNTDPSVTDLTATEQNLIWVIKAQGATITTTNPAEVILTTRVAATENNWTLPVEFASND